MSTKQKVRRNVLDFTIPVMDLEDQVFETGGIVFPDGRCLEIVLNENAVGSLTFLDSENTESQESIRVGEQTYLPPLLASSILQALTLPTERRNCGSTVDIFREISNAFLDHSFSEHAAEAATYFTLASWFPESLPLAPCMVLTGPNAEARILLQLLTCVVRHGLPLAELNAATFHCIPMHVQPTMLIGNLHPSVSKLFYGSIHPHTYSPHNGELVDLCCAKAAYAGSIVGRFSSDSVLQINSALVGTKLPVVNDATLRMISDHFQPKLLDYRLRHAAQVGKSDFDAKMLPLSLRMLARALGSCIVGAPELQAGIIRLLEGQREEVRANRLLDPNCVALEALLAHSHRENESTRVGVSAIANTATEIMAGRGETEAFETKRMGSHLRQLGFHAKRDSKGFAVHLTTDVQRFIHRLAA